jgi:hypothetical protein
VCLKGLPNIHTLLQTIDDECSLWCMAEASKLGPDYPVFGVVCSGPGHVSSHPTPFFGVGGSVFGYLRRVGFLSKSNSFYTLSILMK